MLSVFVPFNYLGRCPPLSSIASPIFMTCLITGIGQGDVWFPFIIPFFVISWKIFFCSFFRRSYVRSIFLISSGKTLGVFFRINSTCSPDMKNEGYVSAKSLFIWSWISPMFKFPPGDTIKVSLLKRLLPLRWLWPFLWSWSFIGSPFVKLWINRNWSIFTPFIPINQIKTGSHEWLPGVTVTKMPFCRIVRRMTIDRIPGVA